MSDTPMPVDVPSRDVVTRASRTNWHTYTPDDMLSAWRDGMKDGDRVGFERGTRVGYERGRNATQRAQEMLLDTNVKTAQQAAERLFADLAGVGVACRRALLRIEALDRFAVAFLVDEEDFVSDRIDEAYAKGEAVEDSVNREDFGFEFLFVPVSEHTDLRCLAADGFRYRYPAAEPEAGGVSIQAEA